MKRYFWAVTAAVFVLSGCSTNQEPEQSSIFAMHTYMTFTAYGNGARAGLDEAEQLIQHLESLWSVTDENSEIWKANHGGGQAVTVSDVTRELIAFSLEMAQSTGGALEPTLYPVLTAWGFTTDDKQIPKQSEIEARLQNVDYRRIRLEGDRLTVPEGMQLDLGAVGKGYTADLITQVLKDHGVESGLISLGGNIQAIGKRPDGSNWRIGIRAPWETGNLGILEVQDVAVVTSGGYENYFEDEEGNVYWHILNPVTGYPADSDLQSVTIVGDSGRLCDALSTALFVMGSDDAEAYWREHGGFEMLMVTKEKELRITQGLAERFSLSAGRTETIQVLA